MRTITLSCLQTEENSDSQGTLHCSDTTNYGYYTKSVADSLSYDLQLYASLSLGEYDYRYLSRFSLIFPYDIDINRDEKIYQAVLKLNCTEYKNWSPYSESVRLFVDLTNVRPHIPIEVSDYNYNFYYDIESIGPFLPDRIDTTISYGEYLITLSERGIDYLRTQTIEKNYIKFFVRSHVYDTLHKRIWILDGIPVEMRMIFSDGINDPSNKPKLILYIDKNYFTGGGLLTDYYGEGFGKYAWRGRKSLNIKK